MASRLHNRSHFFKYASFNTAIRVIESRSFRWSSPVKFNDPFDHQTGFSLRADPSDFARSLTDSIERVVFSDSEPQIAPTSLFSALTLHMRALRHKLPREKVLTELHQASLEVAENLQGHIGSLNAALQEQLCHSRVFCVSEKPDNVVMWSHYADEHRGVVFKLRCLDEIDNALLAAQRVSYTDSFLEFPGADEYARHLTCEAPLDFAPLCWKLAFTKHIDWSYEREWRVHVALLHEPMGDGYSVYEESPDVFDEILLGCRMQPDAVAEITDAVRRYLPNTRVLRGRRSDTAFRLSFEEQL